MIMKTGSMNKAFKTVLKTVALAIAALLVILCAACAAKPDTPAEEATDKPVVTDAPAKPTDAPAKPTEAPAEPTEKPADPTEAPATATKKPSEPTANPYEGIPEPYIDLAFTKDDVYDARENTELWAIDGSVGEYTVNFNGKDVKVTGFHGEDDDDYIKIDLTEYSSDFRGFIEEGITYELFIQIEDTPSSSGGVLICNGNGGGLNMAIRGSQGQLNFNVGSTTQDGTYCGSGFAYAQPYDANEGAQIEERKLVHISGVYDPENRQIKLFYNGELLSAGDIGTGDFKMASTVNGVLGIAYNASLPSESLGRFTEFTIVEARIYRQPLTDEEVRAAYQNCVSALGLAE